MSVPARGPAAGRASYRSALRSREFRGLVGAQVLSGWGDSIARVALASLVLERTGSPFLTVLAFVAAYVPAVFGSPVLGSVARRMRPKSVLLLSDAGRAVVIGLLALAAVDGTPTVALLLLLLVSEFLRAPADVAVRALLPDVLTDPRDRLAGSGLTRVLHRADELVGIVLAGVAIHLLGERTSLLVDAATFVVSFVVVAISVRSHPVHRDDGGRVSSMSALVSGWRRVSDEPALRALVLLGCGSAVFLIAPEAVGLAYARGDGEETSVGAFLMASAPAGAAVGSYAVRRWRPERQVRMIVTLAVLACLPLLATCVAPPWEIALPLWFVSGLCQGFVVPLMACVHLLTPPDQRGVVNGMAAAGFALASAASFLFAGLVADLTTPAVAVTAGGALGLALVGLAHRSWPYGALRRAAAAVERPD